jgi:hypothetical protein
MKDREWIILDFDPNGMVQALSPVLDSDYTKQ